MRVHEDGISETIIPYSWEWDIEDSLEAFAISGAWPWMTQNIPLVAALNIVLLALLVILSWPMRVSALRTRRNRDSL
jgi:hypothetical protein